MASVNFHMIVTNFVIHTSPMPVPDASQYNAEFRRQQSYVFFFYYLLKYTKSLIYFMAN